MINSCRVLVFNNNLIRRGGPDHLIVKSSLNFYLWALFKISTLTQVLLVHSTRTLKKIVNECEQQEFFNVERLMITKASSTWLAQVQ